MDVKKTVYLFLKDTELFHGVPPEMLEEACGSCRIARVKRSQFLYQKGDVANYLYVLKKGYLMELFSYRESLEIVVKVKAPGEYFGETALLTDMNYLNTAITMDDSELVIMPKNVFLKLAWANPEICRVVIRQLVERLTNSAQNMLNSMYMDAPGRLAFTLINLLPTNIDTYRPREVRITQQALASTAGMARQTAAGILGEWRKKGWINTDRGRISVLDYDSLMEIIMNSELRT